MKSITNLFQRLSLFLFGREIARRHRRRMLASRPPVPFAEWEKDFCAAHCISDEVKYFVLRELELELFVDGRRLRANDEFHSLEMLPEGKQDIIDMVGWLPETLEEWCQAKPSAEDLGPIRTVSDLFISIRDWVRIHPFRAREVKLVRKRIRNLR